MKLSRRTVLRGGAVALAAPALGDAWSHVAGCARAAQDAKTNGSHGLSLFGELKYPAGFKHFDYVNPQAPKGGTVRMIAVGTFDNFNMAVVRRAAARSRRASKLIYNTLMAARWTRCRPNTASWRKR